jgi:hypothetical protein
VKLPDGHTVQFWHSRFDTSVARSVSNWLLVHTVRASQRRSTDAVQVLTSNSVGEHSEHEAHTRSVICVGVSDSYWCMLHSVRLVHTKSDVVVASVLMYSLVKSHGVYSVQVRSDERVAATLWNSSPTTQTV